jgi:nondiscriminating glutamyl-tRNA synthetase
MFDIKKLAWINNEYVKRLSKEDAYNLCVPFLAKNYDLTNKSEEWVKELISLFQPQLVAGKDIVDLVKVFFETHVLEDEEGKALMELPEAKKTLDTFKALIAQEEVLNAETIKALLKKTQVESGNKGKMLYMPLRIALTGEMHGPDFTSLLSLLGKEEILKRLG